DTGGAFVQLGNLGITDNLLHAPLFNKAMTTVNLHAVVGGFITQFGQEGFQNRGQETQFVVVGLITGAIAFAVCSHHVVSQTGSVIQHGAATFGDGFLG